jgi:hypothetical protein
MTSVNAELFHREFDYNDDPEPDRCRHGVSLDEDCEDCKDDEAENDAGWREQGRIVDEMLKP